MKKETHGRMNADMPPDPHMYVICKLYTKYILKGNDIDANEEYGFSSIILNFFFLQQKMTSEIGTQDFQVIDWSAGPIGAPTCSKIDGPSPTVVLQFFII